MGNNESLAQGRSLKSFGKVGTLAESMTWSRDNFGFDLGFAWSGPITGSVCGVTGTLSKGVGGLIFPLLSRPAKAGAYIQRVKSPLTAPLLRPVKAGSGGTSTVIRQEHSRSYL